SAGWIRWTSGIRKGSRFFLTPREVGHMLRRHAMVCGASVTLILRVSVASAAPLSVRLTSGLPSPPPVGAGLSFVPPVENPERGMHVFRYSVSEDDGAFRIVRDFSQQQEFVWAPSLHEHEARVRLTVRNNATGATADAELPFRIVSRVKGQRASVTPTV